MGHLFVFDVEPVVLYHGVVSKIEHDGYVVGVKNVTRSNLEVMFGSGYVPDAVSQINVLGHPDQQVLISLDSSSGPVRMVIGGVLVRAVVDIKMLNNGDEVNLFDKFSSLPDSMIRGIKVVVREVQ